MGKEEQIVFYFNEATVQFGFLCLFSPCFTLAPLFSLLTNLLEIQTKMDNMARYSRKFRAHGADGIGIWMMMMTFLSYICIPVNIGIIFFTGHKVKTENGQSVIGDSTEASFRKWLFAKDSGLWTPANVLFLAIFLEHMIFFFKFALALLVADVPYDVVEDEAKRPKLIIRALQRLDDIKEANPDILTYNE